MKKEKSTSRNTKTKNEETVKSRFPISEGVFLGFVSASAYIFTYYYERSFANYFGIPNEVITVSLNTALLFFTIIFGFLGTLFLILDFSTSIFKHLNPVILRTVLPLLTLYLFTVMQIYFYGYAEWKRWIAMLLLALSITIVQFMFPLISQWGVKGYINKLAAQQEHETQSMNFSKLLFNWFGLSPLLLLGLFLFGFILAGTVGTAEALKKSEFLVIKSNPEMVVLRVYGDLAVCAQFKRSAKELSDNFSFISLSQNPQVIYTLESVGPLQRPSKNVSLQTPSITTTPSTITPAFTPTTTTRP